MEEGHRGNPFNRTFTSLAQRWSRDVPSPPGGEGQGEGALVQQNDLSKARARQLRKDMTAAERVLWDALRNRRFLGLKVRRQVPLGPFVADFYCAERSLIIEADGVGHSGKRDMDRDLWLAARGFHILHLSNGDILTNLPGCLDAIARTPPH